MSMVSALYLLVGRFGNATLLDFDQACEALALTKSWGYKLSSAGTFPVPLRKVGNKMYADIRDVASHLDTERDKAEAEFRRSRPSH
ncbi:hypothetical protein [Cupriavidus basilensis]|uniref:Pyocin activator protein PrtN n=1 Tax=Cupriavidus basilensis TaxID=68895 RepID=A0A643G4J1_9BURK|nr:hypothetical protein [Cupriavidus basilensis]MCP3018016.1 hypothetical protein [Cupriavidus basilensis]QOT75096.1 hypothetical protein F7R26_012690 [Cupriavidus basilensis]